MKERLSLKNRMLLLVKSGLILLSIALLVLCDIWVLNSSFNNDNIYHSLLEFQQSWFGFLAEGQFGFSYGKLLLSSNLFLVATIINFITTLVRVFKNTTNKSFSITSDVISILNFVFGAIYYYFVRVSYSGRNLTRWGILVSIILIFISIISLCTLTLNIHRKVKDARNTNNSINLGIRFKIKKLGILLIAMSIICGGCGYYQTHNEGYDQVSREYKAYSYADKELGGMYSPYSFAGMINRSISSEFSKSANAWAPKVQSYENKAKAFYIAGSVLLVLGIIMVLGSKKKEAVGDVEKNIQ